MYATPKPSARSVLAAAILIMAGIFAWRVSGEAALLLHDYHVHLTAVPAADPRPADPPSLIIFGNLAYGSFACRAAGQGTYRCRPLPPPGAIHDPKS
jgi:hypothetical protein